MVNTTQKAEIDKIYKILETIPDPEIPVINVLELGIVRDVDFADGQYVITITPTYSGCPAMEMIEVNIKAGLQENGIDNFTVKTTLTPAWTTDWITDEAKVKLKEYGIAPPVEKTSDTSWILNEEKTVPCPQCDSTNTKLLSQFGSTACKALYKCNDCLEPFDYFKCH